MTNAEKIVLQRRMKISVADRSKEATTLSVGPEFVASLLRNIESLGFAFSPEVIERLLVWSPEQLLEFAKSMMPTLLEMVGADVTYSTMYPNFPSQVMEADEAELYLNAIYHYFGDWAGDRILPYYDKAIRPQVEIPKNLKVISLAGDYEAVELCKSLITSNASLSHSDLEELRILLHHCQEQIQSVLPEAIPFKEIQSVVCAFLLEQVDDCAMYLGRYLRTATDLLRFATELSKGDVSLAGNTKFISFKRKHRRAILEVLNGIRNPQEDLQRYRGKWIRLAERLHPGEFSKRFPNAFAAIQSLRDGKKAETFNSKVEARLQSRDVESAAKLLKTRPGEFARRLDHLLCSNRNANAPIIDEFEHVAKKVSTPLLLQLISHFSRRALDCDTRATPDTPGQTSLQFFDRAIQALVKPGRRDVDAREPMRTVFPKGKISKLVRIPRADKSVAEEDAIAVARICRNALLARFAELPDLGKCFVSSELKKYKVPFSRRSANKSLRTIARGSRLPLPDANIVRLFLWWREGKVSGKRTGRVDLDLSATMYSSQWRYIHHISYTNLRNKKLNCCHSGDITSAPHGASEFIDLDLEKIRSAGVRYVISSIQSYTSVPFCDLPQCYMGWMSREKAGSGEIYEPSTVENKLDLASNCRISIPMVIDLQEGDIVWGDLALRAMPHHQINIEANQRGLVHYGAAITTLETPSLFDLCSLHAKARGEWVESPELADTVFSTNGTVTPFDFDLIASELLT